MAVTRIWTRMLSVSDGPAAIAFWLMMAHIPMGLLFLPAFPPPSLRPSTNTMLLLVLFGVFNGMAHLMFARAFALAPVSVLAPFEYSPLLIGGVIGFLIWAEAPGWTTLAGACLVVAAGLYNVYREQVRRAQERSRMKDNA
jgi:drug/metabolite transporter (DMT)-like permease